MKEPALMPFSYTEISKHTNAVLSGGTKKLKHKL
jgi:hypothetical protein